MALAAIVVAAGAASFVALGMRPDHVANYYRDTLAPAGFSVWLSGLLLATLSPPIVAAAFWFGSQRARYGWLLHVLLLPVTYAVVRGGIAIMLMAAREPDWDGPTGWAAGPAVILMLICPAVYFTALGIEKLRRQRQPANGSLPPNA